MSCRRVDENSEIYNYYMDPQVVNRNNAVCSDFAPGSMQCSNPGTIRKPMSAYADPALFGRSALSSGCPPPSCGNQDINAFTSSPRCIPAWTGLVATKVDDSLTEVDMSNYTMFPNSWSTGYRGINVSQFLPMRMLQAMAANEKFAHCKNSGPATSYSSYRV